MMVTVADRIAQMFELLSRQYGPRGWWPTTTPGETGARYHPGRARPRHSQERFEILVGTILAQNTAWTNAALALRRLQERGWLSPQILAEVALPSLARVIRPSGYFNQKARRLRDFSRFLIALGNPTGMPTGALRRRLLAVF